MSTIVLALVLLALMPYGSGIANVRRCLNGCYCDYTSWLTLYSAVQYEYEMKNITQLPNGCQCNFTLALTQLSIDCKQSVPDAEQFSRQLRSFLSADYKTKYVTSLAVTNTPLTRVPASVCQLLNLTTLSIEHNRITELPDNCFTKLTKLLTLSLSSNTIRRLQDGLFDGLQNLQTLQLSSNQISYIGLRVFSNASDLTSLRTLNLNYNKLTSLEPWWYYRCILGSDTSPVMIYLNANMISNFTNKLQFDFRCEMKRPFGALYLTNNQIVHIMDIWQGWNIADFTKNLCLRNLHGAVYQRMFFYIEGLTYACDCVDFPIYKLAKIMPHWPLVQEVYCNRETFQTELGGEVLANTIPLIEFVCELSDHCPTSCRCVYRPANSTLHVYCSSANISLLPLHLPPLPKINVKYKLDFSNNKLLRRLERRPYFANTSILDISNCSVSEITVEDLTSLSGFKVVSFRENMLQSFPKQASSVTISARLLLGLNPWKCSCANSWMIKWLQSLSYQISDPGEILCRSPTRMYNRNILKSTEEDFCVDPAQRIFTITLSAASAVVALFAMLVITGLLIYKLKEKCYKRWKFHPFDRDECVGEDMDYDVFLCCSSEDDRPHGRRILERIEANGYRVCYHERDFLPGELITDNMGHAIERSKRTLCLISNNFLRR